MSGIDWAPKALCLGALLTGVIPCVVFADAATSQIRIVKTAALTVARLDSGHLYRGDQSGNLSAATCLSTGGGLIPYRISLSSKSSQPDFRLKQTSHDAAISYRVAWLGKQHSHLFEYQNTPSAVFSAETHHECDLSQVRILLDDVDYRAAPNGRYFDTLTVMLHIE